MSVTVGTCVAVTGDTLRAKTALKSVGGGVWVQSMGAWVFPEASRAAVEAAVRAAGVQVTSTVTTTTVTTTTTTHGDIGDGSSAPGGSVPASAPPQPPAAAAVPSVNAQASLTIRPHKKAILVEGDTMNVKQQLKAAGGSWNRALGAWVFPAKRQAEVTALLQADPTNTVTVPSSSAAPPAKKAKTELDPEEDDDEDESDI